jgi:hypothetical protein
MSISNKIRDIKEQLIAGSEKNILIVEGSDDVVAFRLFLDKISNQWENHWVVTDAGSKDNVLEILQCEPGWIGVVDRDDWKDNVIVHKQQELPNLWVLPRFCLENYLILPDELWLALPEVQQGKVNGGKAELKDKILDDINKWIRHGVLWSVINPLWHGVRSLGFNQALLNPDISFDDEAIKSLLIEWHDYLEPEDIYQKFINKYHEVSELPESEQFKKWIHGKAFYQTVVNNILNELLGQKSSKQRKISILRTLPAPDDLIPLWQKMGIQ